MSDTPCPTPEALSRAFTDGPDLALTHHLAGCHHCSRTFRELADLRDLARSLPLNELPHDRIAHLRRDLLHRLDNHNDPQSQPDRPDHTNRHPTWPRIAIAAAIALLIFNLASRWSDPPTTTRATPEYRGILHAAGPAQYLRLGDHNDEIVRLMDGSMIFEVHKLAPEDRFRVITSDAEVEVRGTIFEVKATDDKLTSVRVIEGKVEVRHTQRPTVLLLPGDRWSIDPNPTGTAANTTDTATAANQTPNPIDTAADTANANTAALPPQRDDTDSPTPTPDSAAPTPTPSNADGSVAATSDTKAAPPHHRSDHPRAQPARNPRPHRARPPARVTNAPGPTVAPGPPVAPKTPQETPPSTTEVAFQDGWRALRRGEFDTAVEAFGRASDDPGDGVAEDAAFWKAVALERGGHHARATEALRAFLDHHPGSPRAGAASAMLGWRLLKANNLDEASTRFEAARNHPDPKVCNSALAGLAEIARRKGK